MRSLHTSSSSRQISNKVNNTLPCHLFVHATDHVEGRWKDALIQLQDAPLTLATRLALALCCISPERQQSCLSALRGST